MLIKHKFFKSGFSLVEVMISVTILAFVFILVFKALENFYSAIGYIDSNINGLNMSKAGVDEIINIRNNYFESFPQNGWEEFINDYGTGTFRLSKNKCNIYDDLSEIYLCNIQDHKDEYEGPLDNLGEMTSHTNGIHFYRKIDLDIANTFYLKNIDRIRVATGETLVFKFTDKIYNENNFLLSGFFENNNETLTSSGLDINFLNIDGKVGDGTFNNLNNTNLRYSQLVEYNTGSIINDKDSLVLNTNTNNYTFEFVNELPILTGTGVIPIKIDSDINKNYFNLCNEINKLDIVDCNFNYIFKDNIYSKLIGLEKELSGIDFGNDFTLSFSGSNSNEIWLNINLIVFPDTNTNIYINPNSEIKNNKNKLNKNDYLSAVSESTSGRGIEIPDKPTTIGEVNTNTGYTSLLNIKSTTLLYDGDTFIDNFIINSKIGDINRYQNYNEGK